MAHAGSEAPVFTFGLIADTQYVDLPDGRFRCVLFYLFPSAALYNIKYPYMRNFAWHLSSLHTNGSNFDKTITRRYRQSLEILKEATASFTALQADASHNFVGAVQLGDFVDLQCGSAKTNVHDRHVLMCRSLSSCRFYL